MTSTYEKIVALCKAKGIAVTALERELGFGRGSIGKIKNGNKPSVDRLEKIANYFSVPITHFVKAQYPVDYLVQSKDGSQILVESYVTKKAAAVRIPVLGRVQAGIPIDAQEEILDWEEITPQLALSGDYFALQVRGDSMEPKFSEGDVVIVRQQSDAESGDIVIAIVNGNDATIKKLMKYENGGIALVASNPLYQPLHFSDQEIMDMPVRIIGKVVELRAKF